MHEMALECGHHSPHGQAPSTFPENSHPEATPGAHTGVVYVRKWLQGHYSVDIWNPRCPECGLEGAVEEHRLHVG